MMDLTQIQRIVFGMIQQPLTAAEQMRKRGRDGRRVRAIVDEIIKPNERLTAFERLEIYNRAYWFRILSSLAEDFPGLCAVVGQRKFDRLLVAYLTDCPSESFTLRDLGSRLEAWLGNHLEFAQKVERMAVDMVRLEWADIEVADAAELPRLTSDDLRNLGKDPIFHLQPHLRLLELAYPVDDLLLSIREKEETESDIVSNMVNDRIPRPTGKRPALRKPEKVSLVVHRQDQVVYFKRLEPAAFALLRSMQQGKHLSEAIETSVNSTDQVEYAAEELNGWFANWASLGWFCALSVSETPSTV